MDTKTWPFPNASVSDCYSVKQFQPDEPKEVPMAKDHLSTDDVVIPSVGPYLNRAADLRGVITALLGRLDPQPQRQGLEETPDRVTKAWQFWTKGYAEDPAAILKVFEDGADGYDEMVAVCNIPVYSHCEHHMAPIFGTATVAYIPDGRIVGLSKLSRLVDCFGRRLQVQERLTSQIADALQEHLKPKGVGVFIKARHMCMESRGLCQQGHHTETTALRGVMKTDPSARAEFLAKTQ